MHVAIAWIQDELRWMIGLQMAGGTLLTGLAIAPAARCSRAGGRRERWSHAGPSRARLATHEPARLRRSADALEGDPHRQERRRLDLLGIVAVVAIFGWIGYATYRAGAPAFLEWWQYGSSRTAPDACRWEFNNYLRGITSVIELVCLLVVAGAAAEGVAAERARRPGIACSRPGSAGARSSRPRCLVRCGRPVMELP